MTITLPTLSKLGEEDSELRTVKAQKQTDASDSFVVSSTSAIIKYRLAKLLR